jgi:hypothetical protein
MIKLTDLAEEIKKPENIYAPGKGPSDDTANDFIKKGFKLGEPKVNPETGTSIHDVEYLPDLLEAYRVIRKVRLEEIKPFIEYKDNEEIANLSAGIYEALNRVMKAVNRLNTIVEREKKLIASRNYK